MKFFVALIAVALFYHSEAFAQDDSGFVNKSEAKNLMTNGRKEGKWLEYLDYFGHVVYDTNAPSYKLVIYHDDVPYGIVRRYFKSGRLQDKVRYLNGKPEGLDEGFYENGTPFVKIPYKDGQLNGDWETYFPNGTLKSVIPYKNGQICGVMKGYYESGKIRYERMNDKSRQNGPAKVYYESGALKEYAVYANDSLVSAIYYDESGKQIKKP